ncbi:MAG TPA: DedA family protein [Candidatus Saccharimonadales bacterium]|nr:DedA family protein [Candidatus Saccharimonadales bacterium]
MLQLISHYIIAFIESTKYAGIFVLMALESALIPIPSEVTMPFSGFLASRGDLALIPVILVGTLANLVGSYIAYYIGFFLEETVLLKLIKKYGKFILVSEHEYQKANSWFKKYGDKVIFVSRLLPGLRTVISLPAGVFRMDIKKFTLYTVSGCLIWSTLLAYIGFKLGENWQSLEKYYRKFEFLIIAVIIVLVLVYVQKHLKLLSKKSD